MSPYGDEQLLARYYLIEKLEISKIKKRDFFDVNFDIDIWSQA